MQLPVLDCDGWCWHLGPHGQVAFVNGLEMGGKKWIGSRGLESCNLTANYGFDSVASFPAPK